MYSSLKLENVSKIYNNGQSNKCVALDGIDLEIQEGDYITVWGTNGAGKTSLQDAIAQGNLTCGRIILKDKDITRLPEHKRARFIGRIRQNPLDMFAESLTLEENLAVAFKRNGKRSLKKGINAGLRREIKSKLAHLGLGLEKRLDESIYNLSGGERQAVALLMATISSPQILLLDEHTAALDLEKTKLIEQLTDSIIKEQHITTLWITHKKEQAARFGTRILFMRKGKVVKDISGEERRNISEKELINILEEFQAKSVEERK